MKFRCTAPPLVPPGFAGAQAVATMVRTARAAAGRQNANLCAMTSPPLFVTTELNGQI
jgi:hypothetical protein